MATIKIKRGSSLNLTVVFTAAGGAAFPLTGWALTAQVRDAERTFVQDLTVTETAVVGQALVQVQDTSAWPEGLLRFDVMAIAGDGASAAAGTRSISETVGVYVDKPVTETLPGPAPYDPVTA